MSFHLEWRAGPNHPWSSCWPDVAYSGAEDALECYRRRVRYHSNDYRIVEVMTDAFEPYRVIIQEFLRPIPAPEPPPIPSPTLWDRLLGSEEES